jgi:hypothetical protein
MVLNWFVGKHVDGFDNLHPAYTSSSSSSIGEGVVRGPVDGRFLV